MATQIEYTSKDGLKLYATSRGPSDAALTVLCMHGLTRNAKDFDPMIDAIGEDRYRFISVDVRGRARSQYDPNPENYTPPTYVGDMSVLLDQLGLRKVALIGTSMGGLMSMLMMKAMPERIAGVVINDIGPQVELAGLARIGGYVGAVEPLESWQAAADAVARVQADAFPGKDGAFWMEFARRTFREREDGRVILDYDPAIARSLRKIKAGMVMRFVMWRLFTAMKKAPLLVVRGEISDLFSARTAARMVSRHPAASEVVVPNVGHAPILDEPEAVAGISAFLEGLEATQ
ncbi:MAG: alpha/beta hydrolase [Hyphomonadaceae bacterium]|nr:alpha/beta hydrolase [Hyphomonadaceae bacterium]